MTYVASQTIQGTRHKYHLETTYGKFVLAQEQKKPKYKA